MNSIAGIFETDGRRFGGVVLGADETTATAPAAKPSLPDNTIAVLMELGSGTVADIKERDGLISERFHLDNKTLAYIKRRLEARHADLEQRHEEAKRAVREQGNVLEGLKKKLAEDLQECVRVDNARRLAQSAAHDAEVSRKNLSRFVSKKEIADASKRVDVATEKMENAERKAAEWSQHLHQLELVVVPTENKKLTELIEAEMELAAQLEGRDPVLAKFGFQQR